MAVSGNARAVLAWCITHQSKDAYRTVRGKRLPVVNLNWDGLAQAVGHSSDSRESFCIVHSALDELRADGLLFNYDEGPGTFGHTTLCFVPRD